MLLSCFRNPISKHHPNLITCTYQTNLFNSQTLLTLTWFKTPTSHTLTLHSPALFTSSISLFKTRTGSKSIGKLKLYYDFSKAEFDRVDSAEPGSCFYLAIVRGGRVEFFVGDELTRRVDSGESVSSLVSRREHLFGRRRYAATAMLVGERREVEIECGGGNMKVKIDGKTELVVNRIGWKFRGSERFLIGGSEVDFSWDLFDWVTNGDGGYGVFVFRVRGGGGALPEMVGPEKKLMMKTPVTVGGLVSPAPSWSSSVLQWAEESSDCGMSSGSGLGSNSSEYCGGGGFSLVLYAWRRE